MNTKDFALGVIVTLTIVFASLSVVEYNQASDFGAQLQSRSQVVTTLQTITLQTYTVLQTYTTLETTTYQPVIYVTQTVSYTRTVYDPNAAYTWYETSSVSIPVSWPGVLPPEIVVGTGSQQDYAFNLIVVQTPCVCPPNSTCTCTESYQQVDFSVNQWPTPIGNPVWANFTWNGWTSSPSPSSAALFGGIVTMQWSVNSSVPYLSIQVK
jgi:hypothetical protein